VVPGATNRDFIQRARSDIPALLAEVRRLQSENERLETLALDAKDNALGAILYLEEEVRELRERLAGVSKPTR
jgi:hypothetical protein